jgi:hypothetical protein
VLPHIFDPFFSTHEGSGGMGLGLAMCERIVHDHGGALTVETQLGKGTTFHLELPAAKPASAPRTSPVFTRAKVLLIDDDVAFCRSLTRLLSARCDVSVASNGLVGLAELRKPIIVHDRDSHEAVLGVLTSCLDRRVGGVMHCFSGSAEFAAACVAVGMYVSFAGPVTFKTAHHLQAAAASVPLDRLLIETDSPYLAPVPHRGRRNEPAHVVHVAEKLADLHGLSAADLVARTSENARRLFGLSA